MNGEDLAMNYVVSSIVHGSSALYVRPETNIGDFGKYLSSGLQKRQRHQASRSDALRYFSSMTGIYLPQSKTIGYIEGQTVRYEYSGIVGYHHVDCNVTDSFPPCHFA